MATYFKRKTPAVEIKGGREICTDTAAGKREYRRRTEEMAVRQNMICSICNDRRNPMSLAPGFYLSATFEHEDTRGMGGGRRDDRILKDGKPYNSAAHYICNVKKGSRR